jgi:hypothetical protein
VRQYVTECVHPQEDKSHTTSYSVEDVEFFVTDAGKDLVELMRKKFRICSWILRVKILFFPANARMRAV